MVVHLEDSENKKHIQRINPEIECVLPLGVPMMVQAMQDPGITSVIQRLLSNVDDGVLCRVDVPESVAQQRWDFGDLIRSFKQHHDAILVAVASSAVPGAEITLNPPADFPVQPGMSLFYISATRLGELDWSAL